MKLEKLLNLLTYKTAVNLYFEDNTCTGVCDSTEYIVTANEEHKVAWLEIDPHGTLLVGLYGSNEI